jgi:hypothetical protein
VANFGSVSALPKFLDFDVDDVLPNVGDEGRVVMIDAVQNGQFAFPLTQRLGKLLVDLSHASSKYIPL